MKPLKLLLLSLSLLLSLAAFAQGERTFQDMERKTLKNICIEKPQSPEERFLNHAIRLFLKAHQPDTSILKDENRVFSGLCLRLTPTNQFNISLTSFQYKRLENPQLWGKEGICYKFYTKEEGYEDEELAQAIDAYLNQNTIPKESIYYLNLTGMFPPQDWKYLNMRPSDHRSTLIRGKYMQAYLRQKGNYFIQINRYQDESRYTFGFALYIIDEEQTGSFNIPSKN